MNINGAIYQEYILNCNNLKRKKKEPRRKRHETYKVLALPPRPCLWFHNRAGDFISWS